MSAEDISGAEDDAGAATRDADAGGAAARSGKKAGERDLGHALRTVYSETVKEDVPAELLDLLGRLG